MPEQVSALEERQLIVRSQRGERQAFDQAVRLYQERLYRAIYALVGNVEDTMDVTQEAFNRAYGAIGRFEPGRPFYPWLYRIARNLGLSFLHKRSRRGFTISLDDTDEDHPSLEAVSTQRSPAEEYSLKELQTHISSALEDLKAEDREIIIMKDVQDHSYQHIADLLDIPIGTVMSRLYYARDKMRKKWRSIWAELLIKWVAPVNILKYQRAKVKIMDSAKKQKIQMMAYLDGELEEAERREFENLLLQDEQLRQELAQFQKLKTIMGGSENSEPKVELWDEMPRHAAQKASRGFGWLLLIGGVSLLAICIVFLLWSSEEAPFAVKLALTFLLAGFIILLGSVAERRNRESKTDRYKEIIR